MSETVRCFFALWPDDELRHQLGKLTKDVVKKRARAVKESNLHITLAFLGNIKAEDLDCYIEQADKVSFPSFELSLDQVGYFPKPKVFWAGASQMPDALVQLHRDVNQRASQCGYTPERRPFVPHITLARKCPPMPSGELDPVLSWNINRFCLVQSFTYPEGVQYEVIQEWVSE